MLHAETDAVDQPDTKGNMPPPGTRPSYYEFDPQAAPEVIPSVPEAQEKTGGEPAQGAAADAAENVATSAESPTRTYQLAQCIAYLGRPWLWARQKPYLAVAAATFGLGIIALIVLPIVLHGVALDGGNSHSSTGTSLASSQTAPGPSAMPTTTLPTAAACTNNANWAQNVSFLGISDSNGKTWPYKLADASSAADCCTTCFANFPGGCQGWAYLPWNGTPVPCTIVYGWNSTEGVSTICPDGRANIVLTSSTDRAGSVGGVGPCGQEVD